MNEFAQESERFRSFVRLLEAKDFITHRSAESALDWINDNLQSALEVKNDQIWAGEHLCENCGSKERVLVCNGCYHAQDLDQSHITEIVLRMLYQMWRNERNAGVTRMGFGEWLVAGWQLNNWYSDKLAGAEWEKSGRASDADGN